jgi:HEPN domain-containing protein
MAHEVVRSWLAAVDIDIKAIRNCIHGPEPTMAAAAYHCQQAAEKMLKAILVSANKHPRKSHDIGTLLDDLGPHPLCGDLEALSELTPYAWVYRYPGATPLDAPAPEPTKATIESWIKAIETIRAAFEVIIEPPPRRS